MIRNYFKIAWRNLRKNKVYSFINIFGLAIGMAVTITIGLWVNDELSYNDYFKNKASIAQMFQTQTFNGNKGTGTAIPRPLEMELRENYNDYFKHIIMSSWNFSNYLEYKDTNLSKEGSSMQEGAVDMLGLNIIKGVKDGLKEPNSIMLSASMAKALFGQEEPVGKTIKLNSQYDMNVTAVYEDVPSNNSFSDLYYITPWKHYITTQQWIANSETQWGNNSFQLFLQLANNVTLEQANEAIKLAKYKAAGDEIKQFDPTLQLVPMG
ncbi:MAG: ABC transporter permease, partial [Mangrovimonas sp.]|nr:ABC transporter permease [Mangrovimonas sp.]